MMMLTNYKTRSVYSIILAQGCLTNYYTYKKKDKSVLQILQKQKHLPPSLVQTLQIKSMSFQQARDWGGYLSRMAGSGPGYTAETIITPYIHTMVYHVPTMMRNHGSLKYFSGQGNHCIIEVR